MAKKKFRGDGAHARAFTRNQRGSSKTQDRDGEIKRTIEARRIADANERWLARIMRR
jgi:hypothetical protein